MNIISDNSAQSVFELLKTTQEKFGEKIALREKSESGGWKEFTWNQYVESAERFAGFLTDLDIQPDECVALFLKTAHSFT